MEFDCNSNYILAGSDPVNKKFSFCCCTLKKPWKIYQYYLFHDVITIVKSTIFKLKIINIYILIIL
jgi:hypothetical protein